MYLLRRLVASIEHLAAAERLPYRTRPQPQPELSALALAVAEEGAELARGGVIHEGGEEAPVELERGGHLLRELPDAVDPLAAGERAKRVSAGRGMEAGGRRRTVACAATRVSHGAGRVGGTCGRAVWAARRGPAEGVARRHTTHALHTRTRATHATHATNTTHRKLHALHTRRLQEDRRDVVF